MLFHVMLKLLCQTVLIISYYSYRQRQIMCVSTLNTNLSPIRPEKLPVASREKIMWKINEWLTDTFKLSTFNILFLIILLYWDPNWNTRKYYSKAVQIMKSHILLFLMQWQMSFPVIVYIIYYCPNMLWFNEGDSTFNITSTT